MYESVLKTHESPILIISCSGFYLYNETYQLVSTTGIDVYDTLTVPGGSASINYPTWRESLLEQIDVLKKFHKTLVIYIIDHQDCGVYKKLYGSDDGRESFIHHDHNMKELERVIKQRYPSMIILMYLVSENGTIYQLD